MAYSAPTCGVNLAALDGWDIYVANDAIPSEKYAAEELRDHFERASGMRLPIVHTVRGPRRHIFIGPRKSLRSSSAQVSDDGLGEEDLRIVIRDDIIAIVGGRPRGTLYGVYTFLEEYLGVRFLTPDHTHVPPLGPWRLVGPVDRIYHPPLSFRWSFYGEINRNPAFAARLRCNTIPKDAKFGGITSRQLINHSFAHQIPSRRHGQDHPEYYSLVGRKRLARVHSDSRGSQPCLTNPDVLRIVTREVLKEIENQPDRQNVSVSQNDNTLYCRCEHCAAIDVREGTPMGSLLNLVNGVADEVAQRHPNVKVGTLAYSYSRKPPKSFRPRSNVQIQLCSIECSQVQPINDPDSAKNAAFCRDLIEWGRICEDIGIWSYNTNFHNYLLPCPNLRTLERNIRFFVAHNARGVFMQGAGNAVGAELSGVRNYIISRLLWNPNLSGDALLDEFLSLHYRKAAPSIRRFIDLIHDNAEAKGSTRNCFATPDDFGLDEQIAQTGLELFEEALRQADDAVVRARVEKASIWAYRTAVGTLPWRLSGGQRARWDRGEIKETGSLDPPSSQRARPYMRRLLELCHKHGVTRWSENWSIDDALPVMRVFFGLAEDEPF